MLPRKQSASVKLLITRRDIERGVLIKEIDRLQRHLDDLAGHDGEVLNACHVLQPKLQPQHDILVDDLVLAVRPRPHTSPAARLVRVFAAGVQLAVAVPGHVEIVVGELGALVVEGVGVSDHFLEAGEMDLVADRFAVDGVAGGVVENLEGAGRVEIGIQAGGVRDGGLLDGIANPVGVELGEGHWVNFVVNETVGVPIDGRVDTEGEDVLMVDGEDARVDDGAPWYFNTFVDGLGTDDPGGSDLVGQLTGLVEHEGHDVFVVSNGYDGLDDQFPTANDGCSAGSVVGVLPTDAGVLLMDTDYVFHGHRLSLVGR